MRCSQGLVHSRWPGLVHFMSTHIGIPLCGLVCLQVACPPLVHFQSSHYKMCPSFLHPMPLHGAALWRLYRSYGVKYGAPRWLRAAPRWLRTALRPRGAPLTVPHGARAGLRGASTGHPGAGTAHHGAPRSDHGTASGRHPAPPCGAAPRSLLRSGARSRHGAAP